MTIKLRPHHLMCGLCFQGDGYSQEFVDNIAAIKKRIEEDDTADIIELVSGCDDVCKKCPHKQQSGCEFDEKVLRLDAAYLQSLVLQYGQIISMEKLTASIRHKMDLKKFDENCGNCSWFHLCRPVIDRLIKYKPPAAQEKKQ
jgi:hypothetical protein